MMSSLILALLSFMASMLILIAIFTPVREPFVPRSERLRVLMYVKKVIREKGFFPVTEDSVIAAANACDLSFRDFHLYLAVLEEQRHLHRCFEDGQPSLTTRKPQRPVDSLNAQFEQLLEKSKSTNFTAISSETFSESGRLKRMEIEYCESTRLCRIIVYEFDEDSNELLKSERISQR